MSILTVAFVQLSGEIILAGAQVNSNDRVDSLRRTVEDKLGDGMRCRLFLKGGELAADASVAECGLEDGDTVTAVIKAKCVPIVIPNRQGNATAELKDDGSVVARGNPYDGGDCSIAQAQLTGDVQSLYAAQKAFAALKDNGSAVAWGDACDGGSCSEVAGQLTGGVMGIYPADKAFAALKGDGSVVVWGNPNMGGQMCCASVLDDGYETGSEDEFDYEDEELIQGQLAGGVQRLNAAGGAFAALKEDGLVVTWGDRRDFVTARAF